MDDFAAVLCADRMSLYTKNTDPANPLWLIEGLVEVSTHEFDVVNNAGANWKSACAWAGRKMIDVTSTANKNLAVAFLNEFSVAQARVSTSTGYKLMDRNGNFLSDNWGANELCVRLTPFALSTSTFGANNYKVFTGVYNSFAGRRTCASYGMDLASVQSSAENDFVKSLVSTVQGGLIIGLNDISVENNWKYDNMEPYSYSNWNSGEPNDFYTGEDCVELGTVGWNDVPCLEYTNVRVVCKTSISLASRSALGYRYDILEPKSSFDSARCSNYGMSLMAAGSPAVISVGASLLADAGFEGAYVGGNTCAVLHRAGYFTFNNCALTLPTLCEKSLVLSQYDVPLKTFVLFQTQPNYDTAIQVCAQHGYQIASIQDSVQSNGVTQLLNSAGVSQAFWGATARLSWTGFRYETSAQPLSYYPSGSTFTGMSTYRCVTALSGGGWSGVDCSSRYPVICESFQRSRETFVGSKRIRLLTDTATSFNNAAALCQAQSLRLLNIESSLEQSAAVDLLNSNSIFGSIQAYIGVKYSPILSKTSRVYGYNDAKLVYSAWGSGEPNNYGGNEDCTVLKQGNYWNDIPCDISAFVLCQSPPVTTFVATTKSTSTAVTTQSCATVTSTCPAQTAAQSVIDSVCNGLNNALGLTSSLSICTAALNAAGLSAAGDALGSTIKGVANCENIPILDNGHYAYGSVTGSQVFSTLAGKKLCIVANVCHSTYAVHIEDTIKAEFKVEPVTVTIQLTSAAYAATSELEVTSTTDVWTLNQLQPVTARGQFAFDGQIDISVGLNRGMAVLLTGTGTILVAKKTSSCTVANVFSTAATDLMVMVTGTMQPHLQVDSIGLDLDLSSFMSSSSTFLMVQSGGHNYVTISFQQQRQFSTILTLLSPFSSKIGDILSATSVTIDMKFNFYMDIESSVFALRFEAPTKIFALKLIPSNVVTDFISDALDQFSASTVMIKVQGSSVSLCIESDALGLQCYDIASFEQTLEQLISGAKMAVNTVANFAVDTAGTAYGALNEAGYVVTDLAYYVGPQRIMVAFDSSGRAVNNILNDAGVAFGQVSSPSTLIATQNGLITGRFVGERGMLAVVTSNGGNALTTVYRIGQSVAFLSGDVLNRAGTQITGLTYNLADNSVVFVANVNGQTKNLVANVGSSVTSVSEQAANFLVDSSGNIISTMSSFGSSAVDGIASFFGF
eukprot:c7944_g1_i1.p1 GENE.c7944_g1_i1~~c7944_g1_i1.p1  ORF type:complete len:1227 (-),score=279.82 c7944_g1_i1:69-3635(-)